MLVDVMSHDSRCYIHELVSRKLLHPLYVGGKGEHEPLHFVGLCRSSFSVYSVESKEQEVETSIYAHVSPLESSQRWHSGTVWSIGFGHMTSPFSASYT